MLRPVAVFAALALSSAWAYSEGECSAAIWESVRSAFETRSGRAVGRLVGQGMVSLRLDGISRGRYTADQTTHLMQRFFERTERCELHIDDCDNRGSRRWAEGTLRYTLLETGNSFSEHILLEYCLDDETGRYWLCSIRSVT